MAIRNEKGQFVKGHEVVIPYFKNKELVFDINNGQTLCEKCHLEKTRKEMKENWVNQYASKSCWSVLK